MKTIPVGVIGMGKRGIFFARQYDKSNHPGFELRAVCDLDGTRLEKARVLFGDTVSYFTDMQEMFAKGNIDAVVVATNDPHHVEPTLAALDAGKHVMVEKPLCQTVADAQKIIRAAGKAGGIFQVGFELREVPVFKEMKRLLDEGRIGEVKIGHAFDNVSVGGRYFFHNPNQQKQFYKSLLLQKASHSLDLLNWFMNSRPAKVYGTGGMDYFGKKEDPGLRCRNCDKIDTCLHAVHAGKAQLDYETEGAEETADFCVWSTEMDLNDNSELAITYANGAKATFHECHFTPEYSREFWLVGTKGKMYGHYDNYLRFKIRIEYPHSNNGGDRRIEEFQPCGGAGGHGGGDPALREEFYRRIITNTPGKDVMESAYYSTALAACAEESIESGLPVDIPQLFLPGRRRCCAPPR